MKTEPARRRRRYSLHDTLLLLVVACTVPAMLIAAVLVFSNYQLQRGQLLNQASSQAGQIAAGIERELAGIEAGLRVLAATPALASDDLAAFHALGRRAVGVQSVDNYVVIDRQGRQVLNTLVPFRTPLPEDGGPEQLQEVFRGRATVLSDYFIGPVAERPALAMSVPVRRGGEVVYSLNVGLSPQRIESLLQDHVLPDGWAAVVLDGAATVVASSRDDAWRGGEALPEPLQPENRDGAAMRQADVPGVGAAYVAYRPQAGHEWFVMVVAPQAGMAVQLWTQIFWVAGGMLIALVMGGVLALRVARRVIDSVRGLNDAARAIGTGRPVVLPAVQFKEAEAVGEAIVQASRTAAQIQHMAQHDALTGLANRWLFNELLSQQLRLVRRQRGSLAVLAIDLDGFKAVNDRYGHAVGDGLLKEVAERIRGELRASDTVARMGGDEFSVLLVDADARRAALSAERLRKRLSQPYEGVTCPVSASIGGAEYLGETDTAEALVRRADNCMYAAKRTGRNRVEFSCPDGAGGRT